MKQNKFFYMIVMLLCSVSMMAQEKVITGTVTEVLDNGTKDPIIGANVVLVNNQNRYIKGAVTDIDGNYYLQVPADAKNLKVRATYIGMKPKTVNYNGQTEINFELENEAVLQEVVVTGARGGRDGMGISRMEQTSWRPRPSPPSRKPCRDRSPVLTSTSGVTRVRAAASASVVPVLSAPPTNR